MYSKIQMNITDNQNAIDEFIDCVEKISALINSKYWNGEDVMGIFFNEFNRYKGKSENGQVFTPGHITSLMYRIIDVNSNSLACANMLIHKDGKTNLEQMDTTSQEACD